MIQKDKLLRLTLDTFDLDDEKKKYLFESLIHRLDSFDTDTDLYRYITDRLLKNYTSPNFIRLDQPIKYDSKRTFHDIIGTLDNNLESLLNESHNEKDDRLTIGETLSILKNELDPLDYSILEQLALQDPEAKLNLNYESLINNISQIQKRIEIFSNNGVNILIPKRPIIEVKFTDKDLKIIFGRRNFNGNPLAYFLEHYSNKNLTRGEFEDLDKSLFNALHRHKQMKLAIPITVYNHYNGDPLTFFEKKYRDKKISRWELQQKDGGLYRALFDKGLLDKAISEKILGNPGPKYIEDETLKKLKDLYKKYNGIAIDASSRRNGSLYSYYTILRGWEHLDLNIGKKGGRKLNNEEVNQVIAAYKTYNGNAKRAERNLPWRCSTFINYWRNAGLEIKRGNKK
ncbi:MAG: hypothetical protein V1815_00865 [Candidatus Woesearchaeota archaeon]